MDNQPHPPCSSWHDGRIYRSRIEAISVQMHGKKVILALSRPHREELRDKRPRLDAFAHRYTAYASINSILPHVIFHDYVTKHPRKVLNTLLEL
jgi:hypothetical protein